MDSENNPTLKLGSLSEQHFSALKTMLRNILSTPRAEYIFAQVVEGIPTKETARFKQYNGMNDVENRLDVGSDARTLVKNWISGLDLDSLQVETQVRFRSLG